jgi:hypothetical protein
LCADALYSNNGDANTGIGFAVLHNPSGDSVQLELGKTATRTLTNDQ